jgi:hypothetical protein
MPNKEQAITRRQAAQAIELHGITTKMLVFSYEMIKQSFHGVRGSSIEIHFDLAKEFLNVFRCETIAYILRSLMVCGMNLSFHHQ